MHIEGGEITSRFHATKIKILHNTPKACDFLLWWLAILVWVGFYFLILYLYFYMLTVAEQVLEHLDRAYESGQVRYNDLLNGPH